MTGPILGMLIFLGTLTPFDEAFFRVWCEGKTEGAEMKVYDIQIPMGEYGTRSAKQLVCFAPTKPIEKPPEERRSW